ncbi:DUF4062 domain-containing protein [Leptospira meyeri]|uniref:DUF4062 domain-containing protein n=1 Tax=Leptospira meyeri TaxID=29508 RepID=UPI0010840F4D|nr:DUF4062 domain-containing protein [Leptospira meyeri]TGL10886.1 DUF4062 domain-containing protein [Leptospira meyeri]
MAIPKIFISSTCYDLNDVRDSLSEFIKSVGYEPILSENGDIFYHPDLHTHESCIKEIENCQIFIIIIGGRFGGTYVYDQSKSIVNAEYFCAKSLGIPIFSFVKRSVYEDHRVFTRNKNNKDLASKIQYPSIEKQDTAIKIFDFIDEIRFSQSNNSIFSFEFSKDINHTLRKQFAGLLYDFLINRKHQNESKKSFLLLDQLNQIAKKTEEILENVYKKIEPENANSEIEKIKIRISAKNFIEKVKDIFQIREIEKVTKNSVEKAIQEKNWWDFLIKLGGFYIMELDHDETNDPDDSTEVLLCEYSKFGIDVELNIISNQLTSLYIDLKKLDINEIYSILTDT